MRFAHTNIVARDWKVLADFYVSVFGCKMKPPVREYEGEWLGRATGLDRARLEGAHLILPGYGEEGPTLEIFTYEDMVSGPKMSAATQGFAHIAFEVEDVEKTSMPKMDSQGRIFWGWTQGFPLSTAHSRHREQYRIPKARTWPSKKARRSMASTARLRARLSRLWRSRILE